MQKFLQARLQNKFYWLISLKIIPKYIQKIVNQASALNLIDLSAAK